MVSYCRLTELGREWPSYMLWVLSQLHVDSERLNAQVRFCGLPSPFS